MSGDVLVYTAIGAAAIAAIVGIALLVRGLWRRDLRKQLLGLAGRRAEVDAALRTVQEVMDALASADEGHLIAFALDAGSEERQTLADIARRMRLSAGELAGKSLPRRLWPVADLLASAIDLLAEHVLAVSDGEGAALLDALGRLDVSDVLAGLRAADAALATLCERYGVDIADVYGGGLYI